MRRLGLLPTAQAVTAAVTVCMSSTSYGVSCVSSGVRDGQLYRISRRSLHTGSGAAVSQSPLLRFDLRKHEMEKRRLRDLEKAGIDPNNEDDEPWLAPEEQQRIDEEEEARRAELEEQRKAFLEKRAEEDAQKRQKFKEFRAKQISMSRHRKEEQAEKKEVARQHRRQQNARVEGVEDPATEGKQGVEEADTAASGEGDASTSTSSK